MSSNAINAWDMTLLAASESTFRAGVAVSAAQALQVINANLGRSAETGQVRQMKDRSPGRGMQSNWVDGDVDPFDFSLEYSQKSRTLADSAAKDLVVMKAAGLKQTISAGTSTVFSMTPTPIESGEFASMQLTRYLGAGASLSEVEYLNGCVVKGISWTGGDKEVHVKASGQGASKLAAGAIDSFTFVSGVDDTFVLSETNARLLNVGVPMQIESEIVALTQLFRDGVTGSNIGRALYASSNVSHTAKRLYPYMPPSISYAGTPISEAVASAILGSINPLRIISWEVDLTTGLDMLPAETSSKYRRGAKSVRHDVKVKVKMVLTSDGASLLGYAAARDNLSLTLSQGTSAGGIITFVLPYCEVESFTVPDTNNDIAIVDVSLRVRNNGTGDNAMTITLT